MARCKQCDQTLKRKTWRHGNSAITEETLYCPACGWTTGKCKSLAEALNRANG